MVILLILTLVFLPLSFSEAAKVTESVISQVSFYPSLFYPGKTFQIEIKSSDLLSKASVIIFNKSFDLKKAENENRWVGTTKIPEKIKAGKYVAKIYARPVKARKTFLKRVYFFVKDYKTVDFKYSINPENPAAGESFSIEVKPSPEIIKVSGLFIDTMLSFTQETVDAAWISRNKLSEETPPKIYSLKLFVRADDGGLTVKKSKIEVVPEKQLEEPLQEKVSPQIPEIKKEAEETSAIEGEISEEEDLKTIEIKKEALKTGEIKERDKKAVSERISLGLELNPQPITPGQNLEIKIRPFSEVKNIKVFFEKEKIEVKEDEKGLFWKGIYQIPVDYKPGKYTLNIIATGADGEETTEKFELEIKKELSLPYNIEDLVPLKGKAFFDNNANNKFDKKEKPLAFTNIFFDDFYRQINRKIKTSKEGNFLLNLPQGRYFVYTEKANFSTYCEIKSNSIKILNLALKPKEIFISSNLKCSPYPSLASPGEKVTWIIKSIFNDEIEKVSLIFSKNDFITLVKNKIHDLWEGTYLIPENISLGSHKAKIFVRLKNGLLVTKEITYKIFKS